MAVRRARFVVRGAGADLLLPGQAGRDRHHLPVEEGNPQLKAVRHGHPVGLDQDVAGQPGVDIHQLHGGDVVQFGRLGLVIHRVGHVIGPGRTRPARAGDQSRRNQGCRCSGGAAGWTCTPAGPSP